MAFRAASLSVNIISVIVECPRYPDWPSEMASSGMRIDNQEIAW
jgi:hypothetical protein